MIRPLRDLLVIRRAPGHEPPEMLGGIHLPDYRTRTDEPGIRLSNATGAVCEVLAAGPKCDVKVGQLVHVKDYGGHLAGDEFTHDGKTLTIIRERDLNGICT
jgi:co-chaperonin GroES (HSP10)